MFGELHRCETTHPLNIEKMTGHGPTPNYKSSMPPRHGNGCRVCNTSDKPPVEPPPPIIDNQHLCEHHGEYEDMLNFIETIYGVGLSDWQCKIIKLFAEKKM